MEVRKAKARIFLVKKGVSENKMGKVPEKK